MGDHFIVLGDGDDVSFLPSTPGGGGGDIQDQIDESIDSHNDSADAHSAKTSGRDFASWFTAQIT